MRRIVEGLGLGLARRAARKLGPVVLTLGSGPSGFPRKLSGRRPKLPRQPRRGRVARARSRNFDAGGWPVGLLETTSRATAEASATAMANPRRRTRALRYFGAGGWPVGLPETIFRATAKASATASLALASVVLALGGGPTGFPKKGFRAMQSGGILDPDSHGKGLQFSSKVAAVPGRAAARFQLWRANPILRRASNLSTDNCFIKAGCNNVGYRSQWPLYQSQWPFYQGRPILAKEEFRGKNLWV